MNAYEKKPSRHHDIEKFQVTRMALFTGVAGIASFGFLPPPPSSPSPSPNARRTPRGSVLYSAKWPPYLPSSLQQQMDVGTHSKMLPSLREGQAPGRRAKGEACEGRGTTVSAGALCTPRGGRLARRTPTSSCDVPLPL